MTTFTVNNLSQTAQKLSEASGRPMKDVAEYESARIIEACIRGTPAAKIAKIEARQGKRLYGVHNAGRGRKKYKYTNRFPDPVWAKISEDRKKSLLRKIENRGLSKESWLKLAKAAGFDVKAPAYVQKISSNHPENASFTRTESDSSVKLSFKNSQPTIQKIGGQRILKRAVAGRVKYFQKNLEKGVFESIDKVAKAYPGLVKINPLTGAAMP